MVKKAFISGKTLPFAAAVLLGLGAFTFTYAAYTTTPYCYEGRTMTTTAGSQAAAEAIKANNIAKPRPGKPANHDGACTPADGGPSTPGT